MTLSKKILHKISDHFEVRPDAKNYLPRLQSHRGFRSRDISLREFRFVIQTFRFAKIL
jgi:hypothetical protein